jgi:glycosyltransferase involved in cell wall biosynthesis
MGNQSIVSVIVPVYNGGWCLPQCLAGIRRSSFSRYELIVVDNGSTDDSVAIARAHGAVVLHCPGPSGPGAARNVAVQHAGGELLLFIDADVVVHQDTLARVAAHFHDNADLAAIFGSYDDNPAAPNFLSQYKNLLHHFVHQHGNSHASTFWAGCGAIRKSIFQKVGGFDHSKYPAPSIEDIELGDRMHRRGYRILLDKHLQAQHLKEWRLRSLLRADILYRAIPWAKLILERQGLVNDLNLKASQRISAGLVGLVVGIAPFTFLQPLLCYAILFILGLFLFLNRELFKFFLHRKGFAFVALALPMHMLYFLYSSVTFALCWAQHVMNGKQATISEHAP